MLPRNRVNKLSKRAATTRLAVGCSAAALMGASTVHASTLYHESFFMNNSDPTSFSSGTIDSWFGYSGSGAQPMGGSNGSGGISSPGVDNGTLVGANDGGGTTPARLFYFTPSNGTQSGIFGTNYINNDNINTPSVSLISFYQRNTGALTVDSVAIEVGTQWYAALGKSTAGTPVSTASDGSWTPETLSNPGSAIWTAITFTPNVALTQSPVTGTLVHLPSGKITGAGVYVYQPNPGGGNDNGARIDGFDIEGVVPEPTTLSMVGLAMVPLLTARKRKAQSK